MSELSWIFSETIDPVTPGEVRAILKRSKHQATTASPTEHVTRLFQVALDRFEEWFRLWRFDVNPDKSTALLFTRRTPAQLEDITIFDRTIEWKPAAKYLGVMLDKGLRLKRSAVEYDKDDPTRHKRPKTMIGR